MNHMKRNNWIKIWGLSCLLVAGTTSCEDFLTRDHPTGTTDEKFWKTMNECSNALGQCKSWPKAGYGGGDLSFMCMEGMTDNMYFQSNFEQRIVMMGNGSMVAPTSNNAPSSWESIFWTWQYYYQKIRRCSRFLEHVDAAYFSDEDERIRMKIEARVWRAWYHLNLLRWYGRNDGIPIVTKSVTPNENMLARNTIEECLNFINQEFEEVLQIQNEEAFPFLWDEGRRDRISKSVVLTMKMDINFQFKKYDVAMAAAKQLIDSGVFELYYDTENNATDPSANYRNLFTYVGEQNKERIFFTKDGANDTWFRFMTASVSGQGCAAPLKTLIDTYETIDGKTIQSLSADERQKFEKDPLYKERDPRFKATIMLPGDNSTISNYTYSPFDPGSGDYFGQVGASPSGYLMKKYIDENDRSTGYGSLDFVIYRYAEVLLDYVECLVETGDWQNPDVEKYINMIRQRAGLPNMDKSVYNSQEKVRELYRRERRVEFCFEGKRYDDIRRWGIGPETMTGPIQGAWNPSENAFILIETRNCIFPKYDSWPLPQQEETANPNIDQPTGW